MHKELARLLAERTVIADGAYGTALRGTAPGNAPVELLNLDAPELVRGLARAYVDAGAQVLWSSTFAGTLPVLRGDARRDAVVRAGVRLALEASQGRVPVLAALGPPAGDDPDAGAMYLRLAEVAMEAGACGIVIETVTSARAVCAVVEELVRADIDALVSFTLMPEMEIVMAARAALEVGACAVGINCCDGPESVYAGVLTLREAVDAPIFARPNAGVRGTMPPGEFAGWTRRMINAGVWLVGGCCGTTPEHTAAYSRT